MKNTIKNIISPRLIVGIICLWMTALIFIDLLLHGTWFLDYPIYNWISNSKCNAMTFISKALAHLGGKSGLTILTLLACAVSLLKYKNKKVAILIFTNMIIVGALNFGIKNIIQRPRPGEIRMMNVSGYSFPSGHAMGAMGLWGMLIILACYCIKDSKKKGLVVGLCGIIILCIGMSRIYLGVHYASDVVCGFLITTMYYCAITPIIKRTTIRHGL